MGRRFWWYHAALPGAWLAAAFLLFESLPLDIAISERFYDRAGGLWTYGDSWWANALIHDGGQWFVVAVGLVALSLSAAAAVRHRWRPLLPAALYLTACLALIPLLVGTLKKLSGVPCPWDLQLYGGVYPYVHSLATQPGSLPKGGCFPGAHSASGFALTALYFALRDRYLRVARIALVAALGLGVLFAFGQLVRGAHFVSHDLTSAALAWGICLSLYAAFRGRLLAGRGAARQRSASTAPSSHAMAVLR